MKSILSAILGASLLCNSAQANPQILEEYVFDQPDKADYQALRIKDVVVPLGLSGVKRFDYHGIPITVSCYDSAPFKDSGKRDSLSMTIGNLTIMDTGIDGTLDDAVLGSQRVDPEEFTDMYKQICKELIIPYLEKDMA